MSSLNGDPDPDVAIEMPLISQQHRHGRSHSRKSKLMALLRKNMLVYKRNIAFARRDAIVSVMYFAILTFIVVMTGKPEITGSTAVMDRSDILTGTNTTLVFIPCFGDNCTIPTVAFSDIEDGCSPALSDFIADLPMCAPALSTSRKCVCVPRDTADDYDKITKAHVTVAVRFEAGNLKKFTVYSADVMSDGAPERYASPYVPMPEDPKWSDTTPLIMIAEIEAHLLRRAGGGGVSMDAYRFGQQAVESTGLEARSVGCHEYL
jgi:hypothetical protein